jgi:hypothetical protein
VDANGSANAVRLPMSARSERARRGDGSHLLCDACDPVSAKPKSSAPRSTVLLELDLCPPSEQPEATRVAISARPVGRSVDAGESIKPVVATMCAPLM